MTMKKYFYSLIVIVVFSIGFAASNDPEITEKVVGKYQIEDSKGTIWYFTLTENNVVTAKSQGMNDDDMFYGDWSDGINGCLCIISFTSFHAGNPPIEFPNGCIWSRGEYMELGENGWLYKGHENLKAKNPNARLKMTKQ